MTKAKVATKQKAPARSPIVAILGHVDHGKTTLLDYIRKSHVADREAGGITQSIGAYEAVFQGKKLTFIDTPGHAAFSKMRSRGAAVADIAVLVIAADDGVQPQTVESIKHLKEAGIPYVVAINKSDKEDAKPDMVKGELTEHEVFVEGYGGNVPVVLISGKSGSGVDSLLETILLLAELEDLPYEENAPLAAPVIEAKLDMKKGVFVSVIVRSGKIRVGDYVSATAGRVKVRALFDGTGKSIAQATPGMPVQILGFKVLPQVGEVIKDENAEQEVVAETAPAAPVDLSLIPANRLTIILKTDTAGALEAIKNSLTPETYLVLSATGDISEGDVLLAETTKALILGFNVKVTPTVAKLAETEGVIIKTYKIIYELLEYLEKRVLKLMEPTIDEEELGVATVIKTFEMNGSRIAGCRVEKGLLEVGNTIHLKKTDGTVKEARIKSLRIGKGEMTKVEAGKECGVLLSANLDIHEKDLIIPYKKLKTDD